MVERAVELYASRQCNCAQAVARAWSEKNKPASDIIAELSHGLHGRAADGMCGALHAARMIAGSKAQQVIEGFVKVSGGPTTCRDLRRSNVLSCVQCVSTAAQSLMSVMAE